MCLGVLAAKSSEGAQPVLLLGRGPRQSPTQVSASEEEDMRHWGRPKRRREPRVCVFACAHTCCRTAGAPGGPRHRPDGSGGGAARLAAARSRNVSRNSSLLLKSGSRCFALRCSSF